VLNTSYPDENKVLFMVADGLVTGNGEDMSTPEHLSNILGFDIDEFEDDTFEYECIGVVHTKNRARVYHGILQKGHKFLKYITVVKCGLPEEASTRSPAIAVSATPSLSSWGTTIASTTDAS
jgi:chitin synthase